MVISSISLQVYMHKSESEGRWVVSTLSHPMDCNLPGSSVHGYWSGQLFPPRDLPNAGIKPRSPTLQADSLPSEPPGKPKNTGVGSLSLLQRFFLTQELNWCLRHCRWILYQLSYQGSPYMHKWDQKNWEKEYLMEKCGSHHLLLNDCFFNLSIYSNVCFYLSVNLRQGII